MPTATLARFAATAAVPQRVRRATRRYLLDWLGSTLAGGELEPPAMMRRVVDGLGGAPQATVLADGRRSSAPLAAMANAAAAHVLELDDLDRGSISHPGAPIIAASLATGEREGAGGDALLDAIAIGYEVSIRTGEALGPTHYEHWHTTGTAGTPGAAAAAARLSGLDAAATLRALGSAGTMSAGLWEFLADGAMSKQLHPAKAAHDGVLAALLAAQGFTAATRILEGPKGLLAAMSRDPHVERLTEGLGAGPGETGETAGETMDAWRIEGVSMKVHASCRHTHSAVDAALELRERHALRPDAITSVEVRTYAQGLELLDGMEPVTPYAAKFSLPFCVAAALVHGDLSPARFTEQEIADTGTLALASRVTYAADPAFDARYPREWPSLVRITTAGGETYEAQVDHPSGDPERALSEDDVAAKFQSLTAARLGEAGAAEVAQTVLYAQPPPDPAALVASVARPVATAAAAGATSGEAAGR